MDYKYLDIAWPSPVTVDFLLCSMRKKKLLLIKNMSPESSVYFLGEQLYTHQKTDLSPYKYLSSFRIERKHVQIPFIYLQCLLFEK